MVEFRCSSNKSGTQLSIAPPRTNRCGRFVETAVWGAARKETLMSRVEASIGGEVASGFEEVEEAFRRSAALVARSAFSTSTP